MSDSERWRGPEVDVWCTNAHTPVRVRDMAETDSPYEQCPMCDREFDIETTVEVID